MDCLQTKRKGKDKSAWVRPNSDDIQHIMPQWVVPIYIDGDWSFDSIQPIFKIENSSNIDELFQQLFHGKIFYNRIILQLILFIMKTLKGNNFAL